MPRTHFTVTRFKRGVSPNVSCPESSHRGLKTRRIEPVRPLCLVFSDTRVSKSNGVRHQKCRAFASRYRYQGRKFPKANCRRIPCIRGYLAEPEIPKASIGIAMRTRGDCCGLEVNPLLHTSIELRTRRLISCYTDRATFCELVCQNFSYPQYHIIKRGEAVESPGYQARNRVKRGCRSSCAAGIGSPFCASAK